MAPGYTQNHTNVLPVNPRPLGVQTSGVISDTAADGLTAHAGGGQANALALTSKRNRVTTVASANDSVQIGVAATPGISLTIRNDAGANSMNVFPINGGTDKINALSANAAFAMAAGGGTVTFFCYTAGTWITG